MIRMLFAIVVTGALLLAVGLWFEPRETAEALAPVVDRTLEVAREAPELLAAARAQVPVAPKPPAQQPAPPAAPKPAAPKPAAPKSPAPVAARDPSPEQIDEIIEESIDPIWSEPFSESAAEPAAEDAMRDAGPGGVPDQDAQAGLIRRMLTIYRSVGADG